MWKCRGGGILMIDRERGRETGSKGDRNLFAERSLENVQKFNRFSHNAWVNAWRVKRDLQPS